MDSALTGISETLTSFIQDAGPYGILIDIYIDYSINSFTNQVESDLRGDSFWEKLRHQHWDSFLETLNDYTLGSFIGQTSMGIQVEIPTKYLWENILHDANIFGIDKEEVLRQNDILNDLYHTDNWAKQLYEYFDDAIRSW